MPVITSAKKALRQTKRRTVANQKKRFALKQLLHKMKANRTAKSLSSAYSLFDKLARTGIIHKNKARRLKSRFSTL